MFKVGIYIYISLTDHEIARITERIACNTTVHATVSSLAVPFVSIGTPVPLRSQTLTKKRFQNIHMGRYRDP